MGLKKLYSRLVKKDYFKNRSLSRAKKFFYSLIVCFVLTVMLLLSIWWHGLPVWVCFSPLVAFALVPLFGFMLKDWKNYLYFMLHPRQGRLLILVGKWTTIKRSRQIRFVKWVYPARGYSYMVYGNPEEYDNMTTDERAKFLKAQRKKQGRALHFPEEFGQGSTQAFMTYVIIKAHFGIRPLNQEVKDQYGLTDDRMRRFNINAEMEKMTQGI